MASLISILTLLLLTPGAGSSEEDQARIVEDSRKWVVAVFPSYRLPGEESKPGEESLRERMWRRWGPDGEASPMGQKYLGSGVVVSEKGEIITSDAVIAPKADSVGVRFCDGTMVKASVVARYRRGNLALLKVEASSLVPAPLSMGGVPRRGQIVFTLGNVLDSIGIDGTPGISRGVICRIGRGERGYRGLALETDAAINAGSYGGALVDLKGEVIGIVDTGYSEHRWLGQAIPIGVIREILPDLRKGWTPRGTLGLRTEVTPEGGVAVAGIVEKGPAQRAGLLAGDLIVKAEGKGILLPRDLEGIVAGLPVGATIDVHAVRGAERKTFRVRIGPE